MKIEIKHRYKAKIIFECDADSLRTGLEMAVKNKVYLRGADLRDAYLRGANLGGADLGGANLRDADLRGANLAGAHLADANLGGADLGGANLRDADLRGADLADAYLGGANLRGAHLADANLGGADLGGANLRDADLRGADLADAYLGGADLRGAHLRDADLRELKKDYFKRLALAKHEVPELYKAILSGWIDGSQYEGECACFCGTIAKIRNEQYDHMKIDLRPDSSSPTEKWYTNIRKGDTPDNNQVSKITAEWTKEFLEANEIKVPVMKVGWE